MEDDEYKPFEPIKKMRDKRIQKSKVDVKINALKEEKKKNDKEWVNQDDCQSFTFTMD